MEGGLWGKRIGGRRSVEGRGIQDLGVGDRAAPSAPAVVGF